MGAYFITKKNSNYNYIVVPQIAQIARNKVQTLCSILGRAIVL